MPFLFLSLYDYTLYTTDTEPMILYQEDYKQYPTVIIDTKTSNQSALNLSGLYKSMGVRNAYFHLALLQPELQGVDPYSPLLTEHQKAMIAQECQYNPWYFFREVARVPAKAGLKAQPYKLNRANIALYFSFFSNVDFALIMPRQLGKSLGTDILMVWLELFVLWNSNVNMLTKDNALRVENVERMKNIINLLPKYLYVNRKDADNQQMVTYNERGNKYLTSVAQSSESAALNVGRGMTSPVIHIDEGPFIKFIGTIVPAMLASTTAARAEAEINNMPFGNIFTTTAGKKDDRDGKYMYDMIHGGAIWSELYLDLKDKAELHTVVRKNSKGKKPLINGTFSHRQVGKDDEWLRKVLEVTNAHGDEADRDFFNVWTSGTLKSPLSPRLNDLIKDSERDYEHTSISKNGYLFNWLIPEDEIDYRLANGNFVLGMDTSELVGRDDTGLVLIDITDMSVIGTAAVNESMILLLALYVVDMLVKYRNITVIIERKSSGITFLETLLIELPKHGIDPFTRVYNTVVNNAVGDKKLQAMLNTPLSSRSSFFYESIKTKFGFVTTKESRLELYVNVLPQLAKRAGGSVGCKILSDQIRALVTKNGRIDHTASGHDDMVIAWLLSGWFVMKAKNLQHYGIDPRDCMRLTGSNGHRMSEVELEAQREQKELRDEIDALKDKLAGMTDAFSRVRAEHTLKYLIAISQDDGGVPMTFDGLMKEAEDNKLKPNNNYKKMTATDRFLAAHPDAEITYC